MPDLELVTQDEDTLDRWIQATAVWFGIEAEPVETAYAEIAHFLLNTGPALVRLPGVGDPGFLLVLRGGGRRVALLTPELAVQRVPVEIVRALLCAELEQPILPKLERLLDVAHVPIRQRPHARQAMLIEHVRSMRIGACWVLRMHPGASFVRQIAAVGALRHLLILIVATGASYALMLLSWWVLGRSALAGRVDPGWLLAWGLLLLTLVPFHVLGIWSASKFGIKVGGVLKQRLLAGALQLTPEDVRHQGAGQMLGRVVQSDVVESLGVKGGVLTLVGALELLMTLTLIGQGAGGLLHALLLAGWMAITGALVARYFGAYQRRMDVRLALTHDLVERMVGHRTRLAQEKRECWHDGEDYLVERHFNRLKETDRAAVIFSVLVPRGWLVLGVIGICPTFISRFASPAQLAVALGMVLLAYEAFRRVGAGLVQLIEVGISWGRIAPLFHAAVRQECPCPPDFAIVRLSERDTSDEPSVIIEARDLVFRYGARAKPVLNEYSLRIAVGDRLLVEGSSGSGKSTLGALLSGLRIPQSGLLLCNGLDRHTLGEEGWRRRIVSAPQFHENHILIGTLAFNLLMGRSWPARPEDLKEAEAICRDLELGPLLDRMPSGLHQMVGETGWQLSHGERSRLFIARALLHRAELIILDESFAALDPRTLRRTLECVLRRSRSLVVIAHP